METFRLVRQDDHFEACVQIRVRMAEIEDHIANSASSPELVSQWAAMLEQLTHLLESLNAARTVVE